jgi:tetratricopeptide (TPR) repeat protein
MVNRLCLVMVVKDEAYGLARTLRSALPAIDSFLIWDTGSTDGTQEIARSVLGHLPGEVVEGCEFHDFSQAYNEALDYAELSPGLLHPPRYMLHMMGDEELSGAESLRAFVEKVPPSTLGAHRIAMDGRGYLYELPRLIACASNREWRYRGRTHEALCGPAGKFSGPALSGVKIRRFGESRGPEALRRRYEEDLTLLRQDLLDAPGDARTAFYIGQVLHCLGRHVEALLAYGEVLKAGPAHGYAYEAHIRRGHLFAELGQTQAALDSWCDAHATAPGRCEPLTALARAQLDADRPGAALLLAEHACSLVEPQGMLFSQAGAWGAERWDVLGSCLLRLGEKRRGIEACAKAHRWREAQKEGAGPT